MSNSPDLAPNRAPAAGVNYVFLVSAGSLFFGLAALLLPFLAVGKSEVTLYQLIFDAPASLGSVMGGLDIALLGAVIVAALSGLVLSVVRKSPRVALTAGLLAMVGVLVLGLGMMSRIAEMSIEDVRLYLGFYLPLVLFAAAAGASSNMLGETASRRPNTLVLAEAGMMLALATLLSFIKVYTMPMGGSVTAGSMIPIIVIAMIRGPMVGVTVGALHGMLKMLLGGYIIAPVQALLDYPLAFAVLGLAGFFWIPSLRRRVNKLVLNLLPFAAALVAIGMRFVCHFLSGLWFFGHFAPEGQPAWVYSMLYNSTYLVPEIIITGLLAWMLAPALTKYISTRSASLR